MLLGPRFKSYQLEESRIKMVCPWGLAFLWMFVTKASMLAEFFFALAMLWWEGLRALKIDISS